MTIRINNQEFSEGQAVQIVKPGTIIPGRIDRITLRGEVWVRTEDGMLIANKAELEHRRSR